MPEEVRESMKQDMDSLTRQEVEALLRVSKQYLKEYNRQTYS